MEQNKKPTGKTFKLRSSRTRILRVFHSLLARKWSLLIFFITVVITVLIVIAGVCVYFLVEDDMINKIVLLGLIFILVIIGIASLVLLEYLRRAELKENAIIKKQLPNSPPSTRTYWKYSRASTVSAERSVINENTV